jgi:hypothetical protein
MSVIIQRNNLVNHKITSRLINPIMSYIYIQDPVWCDLYKDKFFYGLDNKFIGNLHCLQFLITIHSVTL